MTRYMWMIRTAEDSGDEALGDVYLSLHGLRSTTKELQLPKRDYEAGTVDSGTLEVRGDLGELQTGTLRTEGSDRESWAPEWIRIINLSDGRQWTAQGGSCSQDGTCPLLQFKRTGDSLAMEKPQPEAPDPEPSPNKSPTAVARTIEVFGKYQGRVVPLAQILKIRAGVKQLAPGGRIFLTDQDSQGFGLGGEPGLWDDLYPGVSPALYGLEPDCAVLASDGSRGWVMDAHYLAMIFGAEWRRVVYGK